MTLTEVKNSIPDDPLNRIPPELLALIQQRNTFFDVHTHVFTIKDVPKKYLGIRVPYNVKLIEFVENLLRKLGMGDASKLDRLANFLDIINRKHSRDIYDMINACYTFHPGGSVFGVLMMDMEVGIEGTPDRSLKDQMGVIRKLRNAFPTKVLPYMAIDPRRPDALEYFHDAFSAGGINKFYGLKVYPCLGYLPSHPRMLQMLEVCHEKQIPVLAHCSGATVHSSYKRIHVQGIRLHADGSEAVIDEEQRFRKRDDYVQFNAPAHWAPVLKRFPKLRLNLAHFGGGDQWEAFLKNKPDTWVHTIIGFFEQYPHVYADFAYTLCDQRFAQKLVVLMATNQKVAERTLFGSDYYMLVRDGNYEVMLNTFRTIMGEPLMKKLAIDNPLKHLFNL